MESGGCSSMFIHFPHPKLNQLNHESKWEIFHSASHVKFQVKRLKRFQPSRGLYESLMLRVQSWLVFSNHLKNMKVNWDDDIPNGKMKVMFQSPPTRISSIQKSVASVAAPMGFTIIFHLFSLLALLKWPQLGYPRFSRTKPLTFLQGGAPVCLLSW